MTDEPVTQRYRLTVAYDGAGFHGWQAQTPPDAAPLRTVQSVLTDVLQRLLGQPLVVSGASRTDAGVHAIGQVAQFDAMCRVPQERLVDAIRSRLPPDLDVLEATPAPPGFDVRRNVLSKQYRYRIHSASQRPLALRGITYHCWHPLDVGRMNAAAVRLIGRYDFAGLAAANHGRLSTVRTVHHCCVERHGEQVHIVVQGDGFLYNMVRILSGTLVEVGRGALPVQRIDEILASGERQLAGPTLPPQGLCLEWIRYGSPEPQA